MVVDDAVFAESDYCGQLEALVYFRDIVDTREVARRYEYMGCTMMAIGNSPRALELFRRAHELFLGAGDSMEATKVMMNIALVSPRHVTDSILRTLLDNRLMKLNESHYMYVLINYFTATDSVIYLDKAIDICRRNRADSMSFLPMLYADRGDYYVRNGRNEEGMAELERALTIMPPGYPHEFSAKIYGGIGDAYRNTGRLKECALAYFKKDSIARIIESEAKESLLINADLQAEIASMEKDHYVERERLRWIYVAAIFGITAIAMAVVFVLYRHSKRRSIEALEADLKYQESQRSLLAASMAMEEKGKFINELSEQINGLTAEGSLPNEYASVLLKMIRRHNMMEEDRSYFMKVHEITGAPFMRKLRNAFPELTEHQLKLASWIASGIDTAQIARIFNIDYSSVNKSRYRLRVKLGLSRDQSLDEFLRSFNPGSDVT